MAIFILHLTSDLLHNEQEWFLQTAAGDTAAFTELFHYYNARLFPFVRRMVRSEAVAEEIVQEVFFRLWVNRDRVALLEQPQAWLFRVASNLSMTHLRNAVNAAAKHAGAYRTTGTTAPDVLDALDGKELEALVEAAVQKLPPKRQQVFRLSRQGGLSHQEIAERLSISSNTVKDHLVIALKFIREYISEQSGYSAGAIVLIEVIQRIL